MNTADANWWKFSIDETERGNKIAGDDASGLREINPTISGGRRLIDYGEYLGLDKLLAAQIPASENPDERAFVTTHHLFEITFKQMIFDLTVISKTFERLLRADDNEFQRLCTASTEHKEFWRPAQIAANRVDYSAEIALPVLFGFLDKSTGKNETFSGAEYFKFRPYLPPASGFQSSQFRLLQRAFGKSELFKIRLFPAQEYSRDYTGEDSAKLVEITSKIVLRDETAIANPDENSPLKQAADVESFANRVLARLAQFAEPNSETSPLKPIEENQTETAIDAFRRILAIHRKDQEKIGEKPVDADEFDKRAIENFEHDLRRAVDHENRKRESLQTARVGAIYLQQTTANSFLNQILIRLTTTEKQLFGAHENSFLSLHLKMAADRIRELQEFARAHNEPEQPAGTGGGGVPYLINARNNLIPFFPFLAAFENVENNDFSSE